MKDGPQRVAVSDEQAVARTVMGDRVAADALAAKYRSVVLSTVYGWTRNLADAEDLTQEILVQAVVRIGELKEPAAFAGWLRTIARNRCRAWYRASSREEIATQPGGEAVQMPDQEASILRREGKQTVVDLLDLLSDSVTLAARLHYVDGLSAPQIADSLDVPVSTIEGRLHRARMRFRAALDQSSTVLYPKNWTGG
jgi:RNA polymerase sigma factor (sigma-70 family)